MRICAEIGLDITAKEEVLKELSEEWYGPSVVQCCRYEWEDGEGCPMHSIIFRGEMTEGEEEKFSDEEFTTWVSGVLGENCWINDIWEEDGD